MSILFSKTEKRKTVLIENGFDYIEERTHENKVIILVIYTMQQTEM